MAETTTTVSFDIKAYEKVKEPLGKGGFGLVHLYELKKGRDGVKQVAVKSLVSGEEEKEKVRKEVDIMCQLRHANVVKYLGTHEEGDHVLIVLEYMNGGSVVDQLKESGKFSEEKTKRYTRDVLQGLSYLHEKTTDKKITIHRDIKGDNVLLDRIDGSKEYTAKLADFGLSKILDTNKSAHTFGGTWNFMSPEMIKTLAGSGHGEKTDIWSIGCVVVQMLTSEPPWKNLGPNRFLLMTTIANCTTRPDYTLTDDISQEARKFIERCFIIEPRDRPSAKDLLEDAFLK